MAAPVDYSYSSDSGESDYSGKPHCLDFSYAMLDAATLAQNLETISSQMAEKTKNTTHYESLILRHNQLITLPDSIAFFTQLKLLDLSGNNLTFLPDSILMLSNLSSLMVKNNMLNDDGIPKNLGQCQTLKEVYLSFSHAFRKFTVILFFSYRLTSQVTVWLDSPTNYWSWTVWNSSTSVAIKSKLFLAVSVDFKSTNNLANDFLYMILFYFGFFYCRLKVLYLGGNRLQEIPAEVGQLQRLQALVLSENQLESLPSSIAQLKRLRSLLLHRNQLTTLPPQIVALKELMEVP